MSKLSSCELIYQRTVLADVRFYLFPRTCISFAFLFHIISKHVPHARVFLLKNIFRYTRPNQE